MNSTKDSGMESETKTETITSTNSTIINLDEIRDSFTRQNSEDENASLISSTLYKLSTDEEESAFIKNASLSLEQAPSFASIQNTSPAKSFSHSQSSPKLNLRRSLRLKN